MPDIYQMRIDLSKVYPYSSSEKWKRQVINEFSDNKIVAMYYDFLRRDKFKKSEEQKKADLKTNKTEQQLNFFDMI